MKKGSYQQGQKRKIIGYFGGFLDDGNGRRSGCSHFCNGKSTNKVDVCMMFIPRSIKYRCWSFLCHGNHGHEDLRFLKADNLQFTTLNYLRGLEVTSLVLRTIDVEYDDKTRSYSKTLRNW